MIGNAVKSIFLENEENLLINGDNVATLTDTNNLEHALLVLTNIGYSKIPVLNKEQQLVGLISLSNVVSEMFDTESINPERLAEIKVSDVMDKNVKATMLPFNIEKILNLLVDANFIPVIDEKEKFLGIVTRKEILKSVNHLAHELELKFDVYEKEIKEGETLSKAFNVYPKR
ncbi:CBS domain-containing protein [Vagococcus carniphilus]|uniref:CBS domain-containing protein n=1 Tax=Vagococcus carniphilus TaxID=218144 RepID=A0AAW8U2Y1_9ENTE|nr:cyclic-di-AMP-binding protein CbpB [Vagococcus carniphilus]MDT2831434.1 CBS domain-containing protein [Vagococcus carniphilus]MDT2832657.1 CBS domain-containing protein [Vagococcus carniphilus]MDT2840156.1 CBS domain-containing protein [Vagococcus carniphilus]MDT2849508.1 CBS domain-containing protein [Vagococcus carniphilus]MDT2855021.1 CBS domain-containing protein [Vagococcus carniphilus]